MALFFDPRDRQGAALARARIRWLADLGARPIAIAQPEERGYLFAGDRGIEDYRSLLAPYPLVDDRPDTRAELQDLGRVLERVPEVPTPRTWRLEIDDPLPDGLTFPLFVRTSRSSWKLGGAISRVRNRPQLRDECDELRRAFGWNASILAREWIDFAPAGEWRRGAIPQEVRVWIVDGIPVAWSFHHLHIIPEPRGFPLVEADVGSIGRHARTIGGAFKARLIVTDFARDRSGSWWLVEADHGSPAGTAHEEVFKFVAQRLEGRSARLVSSSVGMAFTLQETP